jgi:1-pyrroline-5-carboxylate dehydrogenase
MWKHDRRSNIDRYRSSYPRLVGETGGKDFIFAHPRPTSTPRHRDRARRLRVPGPEVLGGSRIYVPKSIWKAR